MEKFLRLVTLQLLRLLEYYERKVCDMQSIFTILSSLKTFYNFQWSVSAVWYVHVMWIKQNAKILCTLSCMMILLHISIRYLSKGIIIRIFSFTKLSTYNYISMDQVVDHCCKDGWETGWEYWNWSSRKKTRVIQPFKVILIRINWVMFIN